MAFVVGVALEWSRGALVFARVPGRDPPGTAAVTPEQMELTATSADPNRYSLLVVHRHRDDWGTDERDLPEPGDEREALLRRLIACNVARERYALTSLTHPLFTDSETTSREGAAPREVLMPTDTVHHPLIEISAILLTMSHALSKSPAGHGRRGVPRGAKGADEDSVHRLQSACLDLALVVVDMLESLPKQVRQGATTVLVSLPTLPVLLSKTGFVAVCAAAVDVALNYAMQSGSTISRSLFVPQVHAMLACFTNPLAVQLQYLAGGKRGPTGSSAVPEVGLLRVAGEAATVPTCVVVIEGGTKGLCAYVMATKPAGFGAPAGAQLDFFCSDASGCGGDAIDSALLHRIISSEVELFTANPLSPSAKTHFLLRIKAFWRHLCCLGSDGRQPTSLPFPYVVDSRTKRFVVTQEMLREIALEINERKLKSLLATVAGRLGARRVDAVLSAGECFSIDVLRDSVARLVAESIPGFKGPVLHEATSAQLSRGELATAAGCCILLGATSRYASATDPVVFEALCRRHPMEKRMHYDLLMQCGSSVDADTWVILVPCGTFLPIVRQQRILVPLAGAPLEVQPRSSHATDPLRNSVVRTAASGSVSRGRCEYEGVVRLIAVTQGKQRVICDRIPDVRFAFPVSLIPAAPSSGGRVSRALLPEYSGPDGVADGDDACIEASAVVTLDRRGRIQVDVVHGPSGTISSSPWLGPFDELSIERVDF